MESKVTVTDSLLEDVYVLIPLLRREDVREIKALGHTAEQALLNGFIYSDKCYTVRVDNEIAGCLESLTIINLKALQVFGF